MKKHIYILFVVFSVVLSITGCTTNTGSDNINVLLQILSKQGGEHGV